MKTFLYAIAALWLLSCSIAGAQNITSLSTQLATPDGQQTSVAQIGAGKVTVVSFWATWCVPCKKEMQAVQPMFEKLKDQGFTFIAISIDNTKTMAKVGPFIKSKGYTFPVLLDPNSDVFKNLNGTDVPYALVFNADGTLHSKHEGYFEGDEVKLEAEIMQMLSAAGNTGGAHQPTSPQ